MTAHAIVPPATLAELRRLPAITTDRLQRRVYPYDGVAASLVGFYRADSGDRSLSEGLESGLDSFLAGRHGKALEIATVLTVFFCYASLYVYYVGDGLESHHEARRKAVKQARKRAEAESRDEQSGM